MEEIRAKEGNYTGRIYAIFSLHIIKWHPLVACVNRMRFIWRYQNYNMKKSYLLLGFTLTAALAIINTGTLKSKITSPPVGSAGDPFTNQTCVQSGCHAGPAQSPATGDLTIKIDESIPGTSSPELNASFKYKPNTEYNIVFSINAFNQRFGFQVAALDAQNNQAGNFVVTNAAQTKINTSVNTGNRQYMGHLNASANKIWNFKWTSPAASTGPVTFYYTYVNANGNGSPDNQDVTYAASVTIQPDNSTAVTDFSALATDVKVFPATTTGDLNIQFAVNDANHFEALMYNSQGALVKTFFNEPFTTGFVNRNVNISDLPAGMYLVQLKSGNAHVTHKIVKQ